MCECVFNQEHALESSIFLHFTRLCSQVRAVRAIACLIRNREGEAKHIHLNLGPRILDTSAFISWRTGH